MKQPGKAIKAVLVDMDGTLYALAPVQRWMARRLACFALAHPMLGWKTVRALSAFRRAQERLRCVGASSLTQAALAAQWSDSSPDFVQTSAARWMEQEPLSAVGRARYPGVTEFFEWAAQRDLSVAVVSDYDPRQKLRALGLDRYIQVFVWAQESEVCAFKPDPRGLILAARRLGIDPADAIYIGDREEVDGAAARAAGMPAILLNHEGKNKERKSNIAATAGSWYEIRDLLHKRICETARGPASSRTDPREVRIGL